MDHVRVYRIKANWESYTYKYQICSVWVCLDLWERYTYKYQICSVWVCLDLWESSLLWIKHSVYPIKGIDICWWWVNDTVKHFWVIRLSSILDIRRKTHICKFICGNRTYPGCWSPWLPGLHMIYGCRVTCGHFIYPHSHIETTIKGVCEGTDESKCLCLVWIIRCQKKK